MDMTDISTLMACPHCDALYRAVQPAPGERAVCARCHAVLASPRRRAGMQVISLALAMLVLVCAAAFLPFLRIEINGVGNSASLIDTAMAFDGVLLQFLALATVSLILAIPALRMALILYVIGPLVFDRPPALRARDAFRLSEQLRPWSMAEIFAIGCAVALVKISDLARVSFGPAFWMFAAAVVIIVLHDRFLCSWSVWNSLDRPSAS